MSDFNYVNTESMSTSLRKKGINIEERSISITNFHNSEQEKDIKEKLNCSGFGRIRTFKLNKDEENWPINPLPILPANKALGTNFHDHLRAQVFQNSVCNWRCWYCFVDFKLLSGNANYSNFKTCDELLDLYLKEPDFPNVIDLTGGQPDLTPEWIPWMMESITSRGLQNQIYLWSDDNLSNDFFWRYLTRDQIKLIQNYPMYGRVGCFKGIDKTSFSLNTKAEPNLFENQFHLAEKLTQLGIDLYFYITLTAPTNTNFEEVINVLFDKFQKIHKFLPLRIVPLEVTKFTPLLSRMSAVTEDLMLGQYMAMEAWKKELNKRFDSELLQLPITNIKL